MPFVRFKQWASKETANTPGAQTEGENCQKTLLALENNHISLTHFFNQYTNYCGNCIPCKNFKKKIIKLDFNLWIIPGVSGGERADRRGLSSLWQLLAGALCVICVGKILVGSVKSHGSHRSHRCIMGPTGLLVLFVYQVSHHTGSL